MIARLEVLDPVGRRITEATNNLGADRCQPKMPTPADLPEDLTALARRNADAMAESASSGFGGLAVDNDSGAVYADGLAMDLTQREAAMLRALLARPGQAVAREQLLERVFPDDTSVQPDAIEVVAYRLRRKLAGNPVKVVTLRGLGYLLKLQS